MTGEQGRHALLTILGVSAGVATGLWLWRRSTDRVRYAPAGAWPPGLAEEVAASLRQDGELSRRPIDVDAIAEGVIELSGSVRTRAESERAVGVAQGSHGVYTVVNRLVVEDEEEHRRETRQRREDGAPELNSRSHSGMGVGMGTRRQSPDTDPDRPNDKQKILERELEPPQVEDVPEDEVDPLPPMGTVEAEELQPGVERAIREAGLEAEPEPEDEPAGVDGPAEDGEPTEGTERS